MPKIKNVNGHYEVYDDNGQFLFSADTIGEAVKELEKEQEEFTPMPFTQVDTEGEEYQNG